MTKTKSASTRAAKSAESKASSSPAKEPAGSEPSLSKESAPQSPVAEPKKSAANEAAPAAAEPQLLDVAAGEEGEEEASSAPKKQKLEFEGSLSREEACAQLEAITKGLAKGSIQLQAKGQSVRLSPSHHFEFELKASSKGSKERLCLEISWRADPEQSLEVIVDDKQ